MIDEQQLIIGAKNLDSKVLANIYDIYSWELYQYAYRQLGNEDFAEECVAETFRRFLEILKRGKGPNNYLRAYLYRIAHNWISDQYRKKSHQDLPLNMDIADDDDLAPEKLVGLRFEQKRIREALLKLTPDQRQMIVLKFLQGWENPEIARAMKRPVGAIKALQHRALKALRKILIDVEEE